MHSTRNVEAVLFAPPLSPLPHPEAAGLGRPTTPGPFFFARPDVAINAALHLIDTASSPARTLWKARNAKTGGPIKARRQFANLFLTLVLCGAASTALAQ